MLPETGPATSYIFHDSPPTLLFMWGSGCFCAVLTIVTTIYNTRQHMGAATSQGFGQDELITSFGVRADRIMQLLLVPAVCSITAVVQMFLPGAANVMALVRSVQLAFAMVRLIELLFILNGSQQHIVSRLPKEKRPIFASPPCCFLRCPVLPELWHLRFFVVGVQQFMFILPLMGILDIYFEHRYADDSAAKKFSGIVVTLSTMFGMWSFKSLLPLITDSIDGLKGHSLGSMEHFLLFQMLAAKLLEKALPFLVPGDFDGNSWVMPHDIFMHILTGFILCVLQLSLSTLGLQAYVADAAMYPSVNYDTELPPDTLATLDMNGVDPHKFRRLDAWVTAAAAIATVSQATAASEEASATGPLLLGHKGPNHMRAEAQKQPAEAPDEEELCEGAF